MVSGQVDSPSTLGPTVVQFAHRLPRTIIDFAAVASLRIEIGSDEPLAGRKFLELTNERQAAIFGHPALSDPTDRKAHGALAREIFREEKRER